MNTLAGTPETNAAAQLRAVASVLNGIARRTFVCVVTARVAIAAITVYALIVTGDEATAAVAVCLLFVVSELADLYASAVRLRGETLARHVDLADSFGWPVEAGERADILADVPTNFLGIDGHDDSGKYFASQLNPGSVRALSNVMESSWWSKHLARFAKRVTLIVLVSLAAILLSLMIVAVQSVGEVSVAHAVSRAAMAVIIAVMTMGVLRLAHGYTAFESHARDVERRAQALLERGGATELTALRVWNDYHAHRAEAPLIPTWIWRMRRKKLTALWDERMATAEPTSARYL